MNCDKAHFWVVTLSTVLCTLQVHSSRLITLLLPAVLRFRGLVKPWSWSRMKSHYMRVTAALFAPYCYYAIFGIVFAWRTTSKTYASLFKIHLSFFNCFGSKASAVFKGVRLFMTRTLPTDIWPSTKGPCIVGVKHRIDLCLVWGDEASRATHLLNCIVWLHSCVCWRGQRETWVVADVGLSADELDKVGEWWEMDLLLCLVITTTRDPFFLATEWQLLYCGYKASSSIQAS